MRRRVTELWGDGIAAELREAVHAAVAALPVETWRYKHGLGLNSDERHIGPYAEDMATLGLSDGVTINPVDVAGLGLVRRR